jgi:hypothetical protein
VNTDELDSALFQAERRVLEIQTKLHRWATESSGRPEENTKLYRLSLELIGVLPVARRPHFDPLPR